MFLLGTLLCTWTLYFLIVFLKLNPYSMPGVILLFFGGCTPTMLGIIMAMTTFRKAEELGWRGFALDPLLDKFGFIKASVLLGLFWGIWHLPLYFMSQTWHGKMGFQLTGFWSFIIMTVGLSVIMSFIYIHTNRSILSAMLIHLSNNFAAQLISGTAGPGYEPRIELIRSLIIIIIGICICTYIKKSNQEHIQAYSGEIRFGGN